MSGSNQDESGATDSRGGGWCTIESDPGVFTSLVESFGCRGCEFAELWSLDDDSLRSVVKDFGRVHGLIFLFKWDAEIERTPATSTRASSSSKDDDDDKDAPEDLFFARQVTHNACATQAILSVLLNSAASGDDEDDDDDKDSAEQKERVPTTAPIDRSSSSSSSSSYLPPLRLGPTLSALKSFASSLPPDLRGEVITSSDEVRDAHNSFARKDAFLIDPADRKRRNRDNDDDAEDVFHFVAYVPYYYRSIEKAAGEESGGGSGGNGGGGGVVYELDGLNAGPVRCGEFGPAENTTLGDDHNDEAAVPVNRTMSWLSVARTAIQERIERYASSEIKFNLMAVVGDRRCHLRRAISALETEEAAEAEAEAILSLASASGGRDGEEGQDPDAASTRKVLRRAERQEQLSRLQMELKRELEKRRQWDIENDRRRHNYLPFCVELIRAVAGTGKLVEMTRKANERAMEARRKALLLKKKGVVNGW